jgi:galactose-1-phosphate uridylyltransferase
MTYHNALQKVFDAIVDKHGLHAGLDYLYYQQIETGFVDPRDLSRNTTFQYDSKQYDVPISILINRIRDAYATKVSNKDVSIKKCCPLCVNNIEVLGQIKKQYVTYCLNGRDYIFALTPFPSFKKHFVVSEYQHTPMRMNGDTLSDMIVLQNALGSQDSILCNSDNPKTGASIVDHHHMQIIAYADLPIGHAKAVHTAVIESDRHPVIVEQLDFPASAIRFTSDNSDDLESVTRQFLHFWKALETGNTCNVWTRHVDGMTELTLILRNPQHKTAVEWHRYKREGIGIIEMCGFGIFPSPKDNAILAEIESGGASILEGIIACHAPVAKNYCKLFEEFLAKND